MGTCLEVEKNVWGKLQVSLKVDFAYAGLRFGSDFTFFLYLGRIWEVFRWIRGFPIGFRGFPLDSISFWGISDVFRGI